MTDYRFPFDELLLLALNGLDWQWLDAIFVAASSRTFGIGIALLFCLWLLVTFRQRATRPVFQAVVASVLADSLGHNFLKPLFHRMRPNAALPQDLVRLFADATASGYSMPSLHAATSFAFVVALGLAQPMTFRLTLPIALLISLSRIGVAVHWPSDVLAGMVYGSLMGFAIDRLCRRAWPKRLHFLH